MQPFVVSLGDPAGVGPEVTARAWEARDRLNLPPFMAVGDAASIRATWAGPIALIDGASQCAAAFPDALPVWHIEDSGPLTPGQPTIEGAHCALHSLELGVGLARSEEAAALITAPVCKDQLYSVGFTHAGQTEFIADRCGVSRTNAVMVLAGPGLRVVPITVHVPFRDVPDLLTQDLIVVRAQAAARGLARSFGIANPRLALAGLNPHAGENGALGSEEQEILIPAIARLREEGMMITGPHSPDAMFTPDMRAQYDAALCLYHDQALIPLKALYFDEGVNLTLGLPIVRTSPDHGTAFNIAGTGMASPGPMISAIQMAQTICQTRARTGS
ncbi:MAG: 4-hydroxythreonine-4-phosphate dehydrogenase PdxA [Sphingopyxis sp.]